MRCAIIKPFVFNKEALHICHFFCLAMKTIFVALFQSVSEILQINTLANLQFEFTEKMNLLIICCFTITILEISVQATPECPEGQHRCANGECHDCCYDSHCGETCGCTICA